MSFACGDILVSAPGIINANYTNQDSIFLSQKINYVRRTKRKTHRADAKSRFLTTRQMKANEMGCPGNETIWELLQKEVKSTASSL